MVSTTLVAGGIATSAGAMTTGAIAGGTGVIGTSAVTTTTFLALGTSLAFLALPIVIVGTTIKEDITYDCWKQVLHEKSEEKTSGITYDELLNSRYIKEIYDDNNENKIIVNEWNEEYNIYPVKIFDDTYMHIEKYILNPTND